MSKNKKRELFAEIACPLCGGMGCFIIKDILTRLEIPWETCSRCNGTGLITYNFFDQQIYLISDKERSE